MIGRMKSLIKSIPLLLKKITFDNIIKFGLLLPVFIPLLEKLPTFFPYVAGKVFIFHIIVEVLDIICRINPVPLKYFKEAFSINKKRIFSLEKLIILFFTVLILSTLFSFDPHKSFWSNAERMTGLFFFLHVFAYYIMLRSFFNKNDFIRLFRVSVIVSFFMFIFTMLYYSEGSRLMSTFGNSGYLVIYLVFNVFFTLYLFIADSKLIWKIFYVLVLLSNIIMIYSADVRAGFVSISIGLLLAFILILKRNKNKIIPIVLIVVLLSACFIYVSRRNPGLLQIKSISDIKTIVFQKRPKAIMGRVHGLEIGWKAFKARPVLGWGLENYILAFPRFLAPGYPLKAWMDKPHNMPMEYLVCTGIFGLIAYLSIFFSAIAGAIKNKNPFLVSLIVSYFVFLLFWFDTSISIMFFFILLAFIQCENRKDEVEKKTDALPSKGIQFKLKAFFLIPVMIYSLYSYNFLPFKASYLVAAGRSIDALSYNTFINYEVRNYIAMEALKGDDKSYIVFAMTQMEKNIEEHPMDIKLYVLLSRIYYKLGNNEKAKNMIYRVAGLLGNTDKPEVLFKSLETLEISK